MSNKMHVRDLPSEVKDALITVAGKTRGARYSCAKGRLRGSKATLALVA